MYAGRTLFAQIMDFLPWSTFYRIVARYGGDYRIRTFRCTDQFRIMAFAQLTYRESLRDIEACLSAQGAKLYHMGIGGTISRSTLADANESRDWRIYADFAQRLIVKARKTRISVSIFPILFMHWILQLSIFVFRCSRGRGSAKQRQQSNFILSWISKELFPASSTSPMANGTTSKF